jgi:hypothetical protein
MRQCGDGGADPDVVVTAPRLWLIAIAVVAAACATARPTPPPELVAATDPRCPLPLAWPSAEQTPRRVRIRNATSDSLVVVIDRCFHYTTVASVAPGATVQASLPPRLIAFPDGIRFHAYIDTEARFVGSWHVPPDPRPALDLVLDSITRARGELFLYDAVREGAPASMPRILEDGEGESYLMLPEVADGGFLIWSCGGGRRWVSMSTGLELPRDTAEVRTRFDGGEWSGDEGWEVLHSLTDAVLVPASAIDSLTARAARAKLVNVGVVTRRYTGFPGRGPPPSVSSFGFRTEELAAGLAALTCYRDLARRLQG